MEEYLFIGGDKRIKYAAELIARSSKVSAKGLCGDFPLPEGRYNRIVLPLPFSRDGININAPFSEEKLPLTIILEYAGKEAVVFSGGSSEELRKLCSDGGLQLIDYFDSEELTLKNALLTAEGAVSLLISGSDISLHGSAALVIGYGRIAAYVARLLRAFRCSVTIAARNPVQRQRAVLDGFCALPAELAGLAASGSDFVINTAPVQLLTEESFQKMCTGSVYMELATRASLPEKNWAEDAGITYIMAGGLPGKFSAKTAGEAVAQSIIAAASGSYA